MDPSRDQQRDAHVPGRRRESGRTAGVPFGGQEPDKAEIEARGFVQHNLPGKERFVKVLRRPTVPARVLLAAERVTTPETARDIGQRLLAVKRSLPHGQFKKWLEANCAFSYRTAARYMKGATVAPLPAARL